MLSSEPNKNFDQASGLRLSTFASYPRVIAVTAGKGGVGKSNISVNLSVAMSHLGQKVLLLDADLGLANVDVLLGLHPRLNLSHLLNGDCDLQDLLIEGPAGISVIPASSGTEAMTRLSQREHAGIIQSFSQLTSAVDVLVIDTAAGISETVTNFTRAAQEVLVVVCDEPTSITDAYALIKVMSKEYGVGRFHIVANMTRGAYEGRELFLKLNRVTQQFLNVTLDYLGAIPFDEHLKRAVRSQRAVSDLYPSSKSAQEIKKIAQTILSWPLPLEVPGQTTFFLERLIQFTAIRGAA